MKVTYDPEVDVLRILFSNAPIEESDEDKPGIIIDYDKDGNVVGMEILDASKRMDNPRAVDYAVVGWLDVKGEKHALSALRNHVREVNIDRGPMSIHLIISANENGA